MSVNLIGISGKAGSGKDLVSSIIKWLTSPKTRIRFREDFDLYMESEETFADNWITKKFADKLKDIVCMLIGCTREQLEDREFKEKELNEEWWFYKGETILVPYSEATEMQRRVLPLRKHNPRTLLQLLGTDCGRNIIHPNIWVNSLFSDYKISKKCDVWEDKYSSESAPYYHLKCADCKKPYAGYKLQPYCKDCAKNNMFYLNWIISDVRFPNELEAIHKRLGIVIRVDRPDIEHLDHQSETALDKHYESFDHLIINEGTIEELIIKVKDILIKEGVIQC